MNRLELPGVRFRPAFFEPTFHKHAKIGCGGCQIHVTDRAAFSPCAAAAALLLECYRADAARFEWRQPPYEYEATKMPIDILAGSPALRQQVEGQMPLEDIVESWESGLSEFEVIRGEFLRYPA